ncbi:ABC transporter ATP-binding protein [Chitinimonas viridis]|uniref:ABC transporter ATP-binding protein n=1 Tax=Chitinimonas viridis TaxID=664880 RepID=A0ABT8B7X6_9NEIS|nr:ABC transporter ATP-binding protein [Chitinimonas viridis]MDN3577900.1 ABC transporter ATP-binding protein [Chitinimonas viridis]
MSEKAIELDRVVKTFKQGFKPRFRALDEVSFSVVEGEAFGFVGQNGAGKSTAIKILTGALRQDGGAARLFGVDVADFRSRRGLGYVPENPWLYDYLTPLEILRMGVVAQGIALDGAELDRHCMQWLERFSIAAVAHKRTRSFSKGMVQRTALAHAMACRPRLLILDEPLSGLDPLGRRDVVDILVEYRQGGGTVFFSSHVLHDVERLADRFGLIHKGRLHTVQRPSDLGGGDEVLSVRTVGIAPVVGMQADVADRWSAQVPASQLWPLLDAARAAGHTVIEIKPALSLERAFLKFVSDLDRSN